MAIAKDREQYEKLTAELEELHNKQKATAENPRSYEEILELIQGDPEDEDE